jgi:hypothetical protein
MVVRPDQRQYDLLDFLIEFKYVSLADVGLSGEAVRRMEREELAALPAVAKKQADAQTKLAGYRETLQSLHDKRLRLRCFSVVAIGYERLVWLEVGQWIVDSGQWIEPYPPLHRFTVPPLQRFNASTLQRFNASTLQHFNVPTLHRFTVPPLHRSNASTLQRSTASTLQRFNASTLQRSNVPTLQRSPVPPILLLRATLRLKSKIS